MPFFLSITTHHGSSVLENGELPSSVKDKLKNLKLETSAFIEWCDSVNIVVVPMGEECMDAYMMPLLKQIITLF